MKLEQIPKEITIGDKYNPAMKILAQEDANKYFELLIQHCMQHGKSREEAEKTERQNLGYYAGYFDVETRKRVEKLFKCSHPIFGSIEENGVPTPEEAFKKGRKASRKKE